MKTSQSYQRLRAVSSETVEKAKQVEKLLRERVEGSPDSEEPDTLPEESCTKAPTRH